MNDNQTRDPLGNANRNFAELAIVDADVGRRQHWTVENPAGLLETNAVLGEICSSFGGIPLEHRPKPVNPICIDNQPARSSRTATSRSNR